MAAPEPDPGRPRVFGIGLNKTGTSSFHQAMTVLGLESLHWGGPPVRRLVEGAIEAGEPLLSRLDPRYDAFSDILALSANFELLDAQYPGSRFVLTVRDVDEWVDSRRRHVEENRRRKAAGEYQGTFLEVDEQAWRAEWEHHVSRVRAHFAGRSDFLEVDLTRAPGWEPFCRLLDRPEPAAPFPWENRGRAPAGADDRPGSGHVRQERTVGDTRTVAKAESGEEHEEAPRTPVVFFHVMKCGGTSVRTALTLSVAGARYGPDVFELDGQAALRAVGGSNPDNWRFRDALLPYVLTTSSPAIVLGHFRYLERYEELLDTAHFVTVLRDPVDRFVSLYRYRRWKEDVDVPVRMSFDEFVDTGRWRKEGHAYVDTFCGRPELDPRSDEAIDLAVANLQRFAAVGFLDELDNFTKRVGSLVDKDIESWALNRSPVPTEAQDDVTPEALERAREVCEPDARIYQAIRDTMS